MWVVQLLNSRILLMLEDVTCGRDLLDCREGPLGSFSKGGDPDWPKDGVDPTQFHLHFQKGNQESSHLAMAQPSRPCDRSYSDVCIITQNVFYSYCILMNDLNLT